MTAIGYALSSEEHRPSGLVRHARLAEEAGFTYALISDHFHPWIDRQGQSPFVWAVIGGIAQETSAIRLGTGVTCPCCASIRRSSPRLRPRPRRCSTAGSSSAWAPGRR